MSNNVRLNYFYENGKTDLDTQKIYYGTQWDNMLEKNYGTFFQKNPVPKNFQNVNVNFQNVLEVLLLCLTKEIDKKFIMVDNDTAQCDNKVHVAK